MERYTVIESKIWVNSVTGAKASIYGACPWRTPGERAHWAIVVQGWTFRDNRLGTVGNGQKPFETKEAAKNFIQSLTEHRTEP